VTPSSGGKHGRFTRRTKSPSVDDDRCVVRILVSPYLVEDGRWRYKKGNIAKTVSLEDARVSEVYDIIERALFGAKRQG
jgi:hypothetical protein